MNDASETIPGYMYGAEAVVNSWISLQELEQLKISVGFTAEDERYLRLAGEVLFDQMTQIVEHWRSGYRGYSTFSVPSPKSLGVRRRSVGCFSRRERSAHICVIRVERATRKNSQLAPSRRVALKMGRRPRCSSVTYRFRYAPSLPTAYFEPTPSPLYARRTVH